MMHNDLKTLLKNIPSKYLALLEPQFIPCSQLVDQLFQAEDTNPETLRQATAAYREYSFQAIEDFDNLHREGEGTRTLFRRARRSDLQRTHFQGLQLAVEMYIEEREKGPASKDAWIIYQVIHRRNIEHIIGYIPEQPEVATP